MTYIGILHLYGMIIQNLYGFIIPKNILFDKLYIINFASIALSWIICKDECIISYIVKKIENPQYNLGDDPENVKDILDLFTNYYQYRFFYNQHILLRLFSLLIVNNRTTKINYFIFIPTCILTLYYNYDITCNLNYRKELYPYFQITLSTYLLITIYKTINN